MARPMPEPAPVTTAMWLASSGMAFSGLGFASRRSLARQVSRVSTHHLMDRAAVPHDIVVRHHELLQRRVDVVEIDIGDEAVEAGIDAARYVAVNIAVTGDQVRDRGEIGEPARHRRVRIVAADAGV